MCSTMPFILASPYLVHWAENIPFNLSPLLHTFVWIRCVFLLFFFFLTFHPSFVCVCVCVCVCAACLFGCASTWVRACVISLRCSELSRYCLDHRTLVCIITDTVHCVQGVRSSQCFFGPPLSLHQVAHSMTIYFKDHRVNRFSNQFLSLGVCNHEVGSVAWRPQMSVDILGTS